MTSTSRSAAARNARTYVPSSVDESEAQRFSEVLESLASTTSERPALVGPHNEEIPLPREAFAVLVQVFEAMKQGLAIHVAPLNAQLTTQEAADYLGHLSPDVRQVARVRQAGIHQARAAPIRAPRRCHRVCRAHAHPASGSAGLARSRRRGRRSVRRP